MILLRTLAFSGGLFVAGLTASFASVAEVVHGAPVTTTEVFEYEGRSVVTSIEVPPEVLGLYWLKSDPTELFAHLERKVTLRGDGTVTTQNIGQGGGPRVLNWGMKVENDRLLVTRYPGPVWMGSHEGENLRAFTLVLRYENGRLEEKALFESQDRLALQGPAGMALLKER